MFLECRGTLSGEDYIGKTSETIKGSHCLRWDSLNSSNTEYAAIRSLTGSVSDHENYCRNPDSKLSPWCFVNSRSALWEYCDIPFCKQSKYSYLILFNDLVLLSMLFSFISRHDRASANKPH